MIAAAPPAPPIALQAEPVAWQHDGEPNNIVSARRKADRVRSHGYVCLSWDGVDMSAPDAKPRERYTIPLYAAQLAPTTDTIVGKVVEIGDDENGQSRLVIHTTAEAIRDTVANLFLRNVTVTLAASEVEKSRGHDE
jgi:hypothetical protein